MYIEGNALILGDSSYLEHHGILGQKWGVRRFQNKDGTRTAAGKAREDRRVLKKGTTVKRTSYGMYDETYDNKKYVSTNDDDAGKWSRYIGEAKARQGAVVFENEYKLTRDVAVATGKDICKIIDSEFKNADVTKLKEDTDYAARALRQDLNNMSREERVSLNFAMQTQSGKKIVKLLKKHGYDALEDDHGKNVSKDPVIILDPGKNMKRTRVTANANYYLDYINHTSIDDSPYLSHHGIKGQRWGVRRFQNKDGTRTAAGKKRDAENLKSSQEAKNVNSKIHSYINKQLSSEDLDTGKSNYDFASNLIKDPDFEKVIMPVVQDIRQTKAKYGNKEPYEFTGDEHQAYMNDIDRLDKKTGELAIAIGLAEKGEPNKKSTPPEGEYERVDMFRYALARYLDEHSPDGYSDEGDWIYHTSIDGTMHIEGNALIINSSYLSHHGIRGQKWGVRRFQNRDGSLTNAGRKRLGYVTKGAVQTVGKAFKAGVKVGGNAVKAAKAHHEKKEAEKLQKKKEKASKTRAGVYANKDLFTAKELKDLNAKFEEQDKLAMARLKKGVEIAKAVGQYAQTAKQIGDAYQSITGKNILSHITEIKSANEAKAKEEKEAADKAKAEAEAAAKKEESKAMAKKALQKNIDAFKADQESDARVKDLEKQGNKTAAKTKLAEYIDRYNQDKAAQEQTKQMMKNQKLQEYIDRANQAKREKDAATLKETTELGKQVIDVLKRHNTDADLLVEDYQNRIANTGKSKKPSSTPDSGNLMNLVRKAKASGETQEAANRAAKALNLLGEKGGGFNTETPKSTPAPAPKPVPSSNNLMAQIRAAQTKLEKPNKNETPAEHKEAQKKLNALEKVANEYKAAANKPGTDSAEVAEKLLKKNKDILDSIKHMDFGDDVYLEHHGVKGQRWGVRRFQNSDGTLTDKGRKHYEKALAKEKRKQVSSDAIRGTLERQHPFAVAASVALGATYAAMLGVASAAAPGAVVAGAAIAAAISGVGTHGIYSVSEAWEGRGTRMRSKKIARYESMLKQSSMEEEMYHVENGTLFIDATDPYLEHHGVLGMKWGKHLRAGKGPADASASAGGGGGEDDEKLKEMAKKAGMSVAEFRTKMAGKIGGAASNVEKKLGITHETTHKPKEKEKSLGKRLEEKLGVTHETTNKPKQSKEAKRIEGMFKDAARKDKAFSGTSPKEKKRVLAKRKSAAIGTKMAKAHGEQAKAYSEQAKAHGEQAKAKKEAAAKAKVPKMNRDSNTPNPFGSYGVSRQDDLINSWADDINRNNKMTRSGWRRKVNYEQPKKEFEKAAQDIHNGKKNVTLSEGAAAYALAREQQAVRRRRHSATIGSRDEKKAKELEAQAKREKSIANRYSKVTKRSAKKVKHFDDTNAVYTEGTRLVVNSKWG